MLGWPAVGGRHIPLGRDHHRPSRKSLPRRSLLRRDPLPSGLPVQTSQGEFQDKSVPSERELAREHLFGHFERAVVAGVDDFEGFVVYLFAVVRSEPGRSFSAGNRAHLQDGSTEVRGFGEGVDEEIRDALI